MTTRAKHGTLVAATVATVTLDKDWRFVEVINRDGADEIYVRVDETAPAVAADENEVLPATRGASVILECPGATTIVKLKSNGTPAYSVIGLGFDEVNRRRSGGAGAAVASESHVGEVGGRLVSVAAGELTRPSDTNAYAALDAISDSTSAPTVLTFANVARINGGSGYITGLRAMSDQSTLVARLRLHLFHTSPTAINDNAAQTLLYANKANRIGHLDLPAMSTEGAGSTAANARNITDRLPFVCASADRNIYGLLETLDAFTPASAQKFYLELRADLN